jgi:UDP-N-acetylglucosamine--N-acetylmuramyl-(pentapeptide) pyrophosphoryl-undecaprenol N-acetylglucosamine transferase
VERQLLRPGGRPAREAAGQEGPLRFRGRPRPRGLREAPRPGGLELSATLAFAGGGTGGHVCPGLAVIDALRGRGFQGRVAWLGSRKESDRAAVEAAGVEFIALPSGKLRRNLSLENLVDAFRVIGGYAAARRALRELAPALLFSKGGYASVPPCAAAASLGIPYFTHESDLTPGLATRLNARKAERVILSYEATRGLLPAASRADAVVAGNPVRASIRKGDAARGRSFLGAPEGLPIALFLGGSQGARQVNELVAAILPALEGKAFVAHQTGEARAGAARSRNGLYRSFPFLIEELPDLLAAAGLVVGRAGASTLWECSALGKPMVLVPLCGSGTRGDQVDNARYFERSGAAACLVGDEATPEALTSAVLDFLLSPEKAAAAGEAARGLAGADAAGAIADIILRRIGEAT